MRTGLWCCAAVAALAIGAPGVVRAQEVSGAAIFHVRCAMCHGAEGRGNGPMAMALNPRPIDFTNPAKRLATSDSAVREVIRGGRRSMPAFRGQLTPAQVDSVAAFIKTLHR